MELAPPESLKSREVFAQANALLRHTSRASNPDWYREALDLDHQWHLVVLGGHRISSALMVRDDQEVTWSQGPALHLTTTPTAEQVDAFIEEILTTNPDFKKARSLGVVLHLGDEFATTEILADVRSPSALEELRDEVIASPATALGDPSISNETTSTRLIPYAGAQTPPLASTITLSRTHEVFVDTLRIVGETRNLPIQVSTVSAPMAFLAILPAFFQFQEARPQFVLLHYPKFSCLAVFNTESNLVQLRSLPHRGRSFPSNLGDAVNTALDSLDLHNPVVTILPLGDADPSPLITQLHATLNNPDQAEVHILRPSVESLAPGIADMRPEMLISAPQFASNEVSPGFKQLYGERWAIQNFLPQLPAVAALYPSQGDMKLLRMSRVAAIVMVLILLGLAALAISTVLRTTSDPSWSHDANLTKALQANLTKSQKDATEFDHWENLLQERSKGWTSMEVLTRLFPENSGVKVENYKQTTRLDALVKGKKVGFTREWQIRGLATNDAAPLLNKLNGREGIGEIFTALHAATNNESFNMNVPGRNLIVSVERSRNTSYEKGPGIPAGDKRRYPFTFSMKITQSFGADDPMALKSTALNAK